MKTLISPKIYDKKYFLTNCGGYEEFTKSRGRQLPFRLKKCLDFARIQRGEVVLDLGCGRGETTMHGGLIGGKNCWVGLFRRRIKIIKRSTKRV